MRPLQLSVLFPLLAICQAQFAFAELSAKQIIDRALSRNLFGFENAEVVLKMDLHGKSGAVRTRTLRIKSRKTKAKLNQTFARFLAPNDVAGTTFLTHEVKDANDDQFIYLPAFNKVKRINARQKNQSFMGTDFTYADLQSQSLKSAHLVKKPDTKLSGQTVFLIESTPKKEEDSQYSKVNVWIHQKTFIPMQMKFFDKQAAPLKLFRVFKVKKQDEKWIIMKSEMQNIQKGTKTVLHIQSIDTKARFSDQDFSKNNMRR